MRQLKVKIAENKKISEDFYKIRVGSAYLAKRSKPGQFVEVKCSDGFEPLLPRPLGVHRISNNGIEILYEVVGKGTKLLSTRTKGDILDLIGPLGKGFESPIAGGPAILIAGGVGAAPLVALAENLVHSKRKKIKVYVLIGARTKSHILCANDFKKLGAEMIIYTEDGSLGKKGLITSGLNYLLSTIDHRLLTIYACGPRAMLKAVAKIAETKRIPCQVSMEELMACGVGVCLGCPVKVRTASTQYAIHNTQYEYKMVCKDGPVFDAKDIIWER